MKKNLQEVVINSLSTTNETFYLLPNGNSKVVAQSADNTDSVVGNLSMKGYMLPNKVYTTGSQTYPAGVISGVPAFFIPVITFNFALMAKLGEVISAGIKFTATPADNSGCVMRKFDDGTVGDIISYDDDGYFDLTPVVSSAVKGDVTLCIYNENSTSVRYFSSNENEDITARPVLTVTYIPFESALQGQEYLEIQAGEISCNIDVLKGVPYINRPLISLGGLKAPLNMSLNYNTESVNNGYIKDNGLPVGCLTDYNRYCVPESYNDSSGSTKKYYAYTDGQGQKHIFRYAQNSSTLWVDCRGTGLLLEENTGSIKIFDEDGNSILFDTNGRLTSIVEKMSDSVNAVTNIKYTDNISNKILSVTDGMNRIATFSYNDSSATVSYNGVEKVIIKKDSNGNLSQIIRKSGTTTETDDFTSDQRGALTAVTAANGDTLNLTYIDSVRLSRLYTLQNDKTYNFGYGYLQTTVTDNKGVTQIYNFNEDGEIINSYEQNATEQDSVRFVDRDSCQYYSGKLLTNYYNTFMFGSIPGLILDDVAAPTTLTPSSSVICYNVTVNRFAVFSARIRVEGAYKQTATEDADIRIEMFDSIEPENKLAELEFNPFVEGVQIAAKPFVTVIDRDLLGHRLKLKIHINCRAAKIVLFALCIGPMNGSVEKLCCDKYLGFGAFSNASYSHYMGKNTSVDFNSGVGADDEIILQSEDYLANAKNYQTRVNGKWNFWYDRKRKMVADVTSARVNFSTGQAFDFSTDKLYELTVDNSTDVTFVNKTYSRTAQYYLTVYKQSSNANVSNKTEYYYYDSCYNLVKSQTDKTVSENSYNSDGYLTREKVTANSSPAQNIVTEYTYSADFLSSEKNYLSTTTSTARYAYDNFGNVSKTTAPNLFATDYVYDTFGDRLESVSGTVNGKLNKNEIKYSNGKVTEVTHNGYNYGFVYNARNNIEKININGTAYLTRNYTYSDTNDSVITVYGNATAQTIPHVLTYDKYGRLIYDNTSVYLYASPKTEEELEAVYSATSYDGSFPVNSASLLYRLIDNYINSKTKYEYNILNQLTRAEETLSGGAVLESVTEYNARNLPEKVSFNYKGANLENLTYTYETDDVRDSDRVKSTVTRSGGATYELTTDRDELNRITREVLKHGYFSCVKDYGYYADNIHTNGTTEYVKDVSAKYYAFGNNTLSFSESCEYDINRNITKHIYSGNSVTYAYDALNRITRENNEALNKTYTYDYDAGGNVISKKEYAYTTGTLGTATKTYGYTYGNAMKDQLTVWNGKSFTYDNCGNPTKYKGETMGWFRGRLLSSYNKNGTQYTFTYDINGIRRKKSTSSGYTEYLVSGGKLIGQNYYASGASEPSKKITFIYTHNGLTGCVIDKMTYVYQKDVFGNVVALISGVMPVAYYQYDAWGNCKVLNPNGTENTDPNFAGNVNPIRYRSYYYDADIGLYYLQTRYYDPETGRFINLDQIEYLAPDQLNGLNLYAYCLNNPVMNVDPEGTSLLITLALILGGILVGSAINGVLAGTNATEDESFGSAFVGGFVNGLISGIGLAAGLALAATGGIPLLIAGGAIAVAGGFAGGVLGSAVTQKIAYGDVDWKVASIAGTISATTNFMLFAGLKTSGIYSVLNSFLKRLSENLAINIIPLSMSIYLGTLPMFNPHYLRGKL